LALLLATVVRILQPLALFRRRLALAALFARRVFLHFVELKAKEARPVLALALALSKRVFKPGLFLA